ncbi:helix-turn-helix transcriptional regulator [Acetobacter sp. KSO5]|uniref:LexA family transcriptional regulator n=1 Tax=Acetobacter sp. KSO5 TaxID=3373674 RepID=UPI00376F1D49
MKKTIDKDWFKKAIKKAGFKSQNAFAEAVGLTGPKFTNTLKGDRRIQADEIEKMASALGESDKDIKIALGIEIKSICEYKIAGYVSAADRVVLYDQDEMETDVIELPIFYYKGVTLRVKGESMTPRYKPNEIIGIRLPGLEKPTMNLFGKDVVAQLADGRLVLKTIYKGEDEGSYSLISVNPNVPPIIGAKIEWIAPVDFHISL